MANIRLFSNYTCLGLSILLLSACGFTLRGSQALPDTFKQVIIDSKVQYSELTRALVKRLPVYQLSALVSNDETVLNNATGAFVLLKLEPEKFERRLLSLFSSGQVAEYEIVYIVNYSVTFPGKQIIKNSFRVSREYQDDPDQILAKSRELNLILAELREESADRMIRLLSTQFSSAIDEDDQQAMLKDPALESGE